MTNAEGVATQAVLGLPGGVSVTLPVGGGAQVWSYPNLHGDVMAVVDGAGVKQGLTRTYDPFGNPVRGTTPDNLAGSFDWGWLGGAGRPVEHEGALQPTIEMGARQYSPRIGRFLEVDPIEGGSCNDYDYTCGDPLNALDLSGERIWTRLGSMVRLAALKVARIAGSITRPVAHRRGKCDPVKARYSGGCTPSGDPMPTGYPPELRPGQYKDPCETARLHPDCGGPVPGSNVDLSPVVDFFRTHRFERTRCVISTIGYVLRPNGVFRGCFVMPEGVLAPQDPVERWGIA